MSSRTQRYLLMSAALAGLVSAPPIGNTDPAATQWQLEILRDNFGSGSAITGEYIQFFDRDDNPLVPVSVVADNESFGAASNILVDNTSYWGHSPNAAGTLTFTFAESVQVAYFTWRARSDGDVNARQSPFAGFLKYKPAASFETLSPFWMPGSRWVSGETKTFRYEEVDAASATHWRLLFPHSLDASGAIANTEIELRATVDGADLAAAGTVTASSVYQSSATYSADKATDADDGTFWHNGSFADGLPEWWQCVLAAPAAIAQYGLMPRSGFLYQFCEVSVLQFSTDSGTTWNNVRWDRHVTPDTFYLMTFPATPLPDLRVSQFGLGLVAKAPPTVQISQFGLGLLAKAPPTVQISQFGLGVLTKAQPETVQVSQFGLGLIVKEPE